jgi:hypothetical protein
MVIVEYVFGIVKRNCPERSGGGSAGIGGAGERGGMVECTPKVRHQIKGPATLNGGELCWCPDNSILVN